MVRLICHELRKMWGRRAFLFFAALILLVNLILLFVAGNGRDGRLAPAYRQLTGEMVQKVFHQSKQLPKLLC